MTIDEYSLKSEPVRNEDLVAIRKLAVEDLWLWAKRAFGAGIALVIAFACAFLFSPGHSLHAHWSLVGKFLLFLSVGLLGGFAISLGMAFSCWFSARQLKKAERTGLIPDWLK